MIKEMKTRKELRKFGLIMTVPFTIFGGYLWWIGSEVSIYLFGLSAFFLFSGLIFPWLLYPIEKWWMIFVELLGWIMTRVILTLTFFLAIMPLGLVLRLMGKDLLQRQVDKQLESYWQPVASDSPGSRPTLPY